MIELVYEGTAPIRFGDKPCCHGNTITVTEADAKVLCERYAFKRKAAKKAAKTKLEG